MTPPGFAQVRAAAARIAPHAHRTPVLTSRLLDAAHGARFFFKAEPLQRTGSFKFRGAANAVALLAQSGPPAGICAFSSGNHAQAVAHAAALHGLPATIVMPHDAPPEKRAATEAYGATIIGYDRQTEDREAIATALAVGRNLALVPPFDHPDIIAGQGTAAAELFDQAGPLDLLLVCLGGGGLLAGSALSAHALSPGCRVIGVEPQAGDDGAQSMRRGERVRIAVPKSIADGALTQQVGALPFAIMQRHVADVLTVPDQALIDTMRLLVERLKLVVEPTGCLAAAAALGGAVPVAGLRVGIILSGGNIAADRLARLIAAPG